MPKMKNDLINKKLRKIEREIEIKKKKLQEDKETIQLLESERTKILVDYLLSKELSISKILELIKKLDNEENIYED